jgi:hypothetical protein
MITSILLKLKDGLRLNMGRNADPRDAARLKVRVEDWVTSGVTIQLGNQRGEVVEIPPSAIEGVELSTEDTPPTGFRVPDMRQEVPVKVAPIVNAASAPPGPGSVAEARPRRATLQRLERQDPGPQMKG